MTDSLRSDKESKLIDISKSYHDAIRQKDASQLKKLFGDKIVLYGDKVTIQDNIVGSKNVTTYFQTFFDKYDFERVQSFGAVDENDNAAFSIVTDKGVAPKNGNRKQPSNVISLTLLEIGQNYEISGIYIARQLPYDEAERKLKKVPDYHGTSFNAETLENDEIKPDADRAKQHEQAANAWNEIFITGDASKADGIADKDITIHNLLISSEQQGLQQWKDSLKDIFKDWESKGNEHITAVTPGNKAFLFWKSSGVYKDDWVSNWGLNLLIFNESGKIKEVATIYQPFPGQRESLLKSA